MKEAMNEPDLFRKHSTLRERYAPVELEFKQLVYTVEKRGRMGERLQILKGVSGCCGAGRVLAIMGPSGSGKTSLLDVLAGAVGKNFRGGSVTGEVLENGSPLRRSQFRRISCYVPQRDVLMASSTVREAITLSALLKLPAVMSRLSKLRRVNAVLEELDLRECADVMIGDEAQQMKGISGGQKRRVSVGMELVKDPRVIFMDEPTSGLDSENAVALMDLLMDLARSKGRTIAVTIHQPNSIITTNFDDFLLLCTGRVVYSGPWNKAVAFFGNCGFPCPVYQNPTDFFMKVLKDSANADTLVARFKQEGSCLPRLSDVEEGSKHAPTSQPGGPAMEMTASPSGALDVARSGNELKSNFAAMQPTANFWTQAWLLTGRMYRQFWRNPNMLLVEISQYCFMAIFVGLVYLQADNSVESGAHDRMFSIFLAMSILGFCPAFTATLTWDHERVLLRRESQSGMYSIPAWFLARSVTIVPFQTVQTTVYCVISFFMVGYYIGVSQFFVYLAAFIMYQITSESVGELCAMVTSAATFAILILTFVMLFVMTFAGFLVSNIPVYFRWCQRISYLTYAFAAVMKSQFDVTTFYTAEGIAVPGSLLIPDSVNNKLSAGINLVVLFGIMVGVRLLAYLGLDIACRFHLT